MEELDRLVDEKLMEAENEADRELSRQMRDYGYEEWPPTQSEDGWILLKESPYQGRRI